MVLSWFLITDSLKISDFRKVRYSARLISQSFRTLLMETQKMNFIFFVIRCLSKI